MVSYLMITNSNIRFFDVVFDPSGVDRLVTFGRSDLIQCKRRVFTGRVSNARHFTSN